MTYAEMNFRLFRGSSEGYAVIFENHLPAGYGQEANEDAFLNKIEMENALNDTADELHDSTTPLYKAADGLLYKVVGNLDTRCRAWARAELIPDRGERLKAFRGGMTLEALAVKSGIIAQNISRLEKGGRDIRKASGETLLKLAQALDVTMEELVK